MNNDPIGEALDEAIQRHEDALQKLRQAREEHHRQHTARRRRRTRKGGFRRGSLPSQVAEVLREVKEPLTTAEIVIFLEGRDIKTSTRIVSAGLARYVKARKVFGQTEDGKYELLEK